MAVEYERVLCINGIYPWKQPDMRLRDELSRRQPGPDGLATLTLEEVKKIIGNNNNKFVKGIINGMGVFSPAGRKKAPVEWSFTPQGLLPIGGNGHGEPHEGARR